MNPKLSLRARALNHLSRREMSRQELEQKLTPYAQTPQEVIDVLDEFSDRGWQSDERFTDSFINYRSQRYGRRRLAEELKHKGITEDLIKEYQLSKEDEIKNALAVLEKKFAQLPQSPEEKNKQLRFMAYRGFDFDTIYAAFALRKEAQENLTE